MILGEKLRQLRNSKSMSQEKFAEEMNVTRQAVSKWELDQSLPEMDKLIEISDYFNVTLDYLVKNEEVSDNKDTGIVITGGYEFLEYVIYIGILLALASIRFMIMGDYIAGTVLVVASCVIIGINIAKHKK